MSVVNVSILREINRSSVSLVAKRCDHVRDCTENFTNKIIELTFVTTLNILLKIPNMTHFDLLVYNCNLQLSRFHVKMCSFDDIAHWRALGRSFDSRYEPFKNFIISKLAWSVWRTGLVGGFRWFQASYHPISRDVSPSDLQFRRDAV